MNPILPVMRVLLLLILIKYHGLDRVRRDSWSIAKQHWRVMPGTSYTFDLTDT